MNIIFDLGGVLMMHNMPGCIQAFLDLMGEDGMKRGLGMLPNGEGVDGSLMEKFECGEVTEREFLDGVLRYSHPGTTDADIIRAWNTMHAGIPEHLLAKVHALAQQGHHLFVLSNNNAIHYQDIMSYYDMSCFEHMFFSHLLHTRKPQRQIYEAVCAYLREHGLDKDETWFIDDIEVNRQMGEQFGWKTAEHL